MERAASSRRCEKCAAGEPEMHRTDALALPVVRVLYGSVQTLSCDTDEDTGNSVEILNLWIATTKVYFFASESNE
jgi:hypothetical protein